MLRNVLFKPEEDAAAIQEDYELYQIHADPEFLA